MATLRAACLLAAFVIVTLVLVPVQWLGLKLGLSFSRHLPHAYHRLVCRILGLKLTIIGTPLKGGVLMTANHNGWLDIPILSSAAEISFVAKEEVGGWAFFGTLARLQRTIFIRRARANALADRDIIRKRLEAGEVLVLFPEGTSSDGNRVLPFKSALLSAAELTLEGKTKAGSVPVQPVSIAYTGLHGMPMGREMRPFFAWYGDMDLVPHFWEAFVTGPIDAVVEFHPPLSLAAVGGRKELAYLAEKSVRAGLVRALSGGRGTSEIRNEELREAFREDRTDLEETEDEAA